jgi:hypothetical protein
MPFTIKGIYDIAKIPITPSSAQLNVYDIKGAHNQQKIKGIAADEQHEGSR